MLDRELPSTPREIGVVEKGTQVVLAENGGRALALVLPPFEDLAQISELRARQFSLHDTSMRGLQDARECGRAELEELKRNEHRFEHSATFFNRVANLAVVAGDYEEEARSLERARELSPDAFFVHRIADNLITRHRESDAEKLFASLDLQRDLYANLRLAFFHVERRDVERAEHCIERALLIDPLDFAARLFEGGLLLFRGKYENAIQSFRIAVEARQTATLYTNMGLAYAMLNMTDKGVTSLKKAVAMDPLHVNALALLADLAFREKRNEEALPSLRYFVQFEQKNAEIWSRLARACFHLGMVDETVAALKHQASLGETTGIWNNLGVCYQAQRNPERALQAFKHAITLSKSNRGRDYFLAARNLIQALGNARFGWREVLELISSVIAEDRSDLCIRDDVLSDIYAYYIVTLNNLMEYNRAKEFSESLLSNSGTSLRLKAWIVNNLINYYTLYDDSQRSVQLVREYESLVGNRAEMRDVERRIVFFNNAAFAFAERGEMEQAERYLSRISAQIHRSPYPTATLGLIQFRRGNAERGSALYREAVGLAKGEFDKGRIRQKLNLELGRYWLRKKPNVARRNLERAVKASPGEKALCDQAMSLLRALPVEH